MKWPVFPSAAGVVEMVSGDLRPPGAGILCRVRESACLNCGAVSATRKPARRTVAAWRGELGEVAAGAGDRGINLLVNVIRAELEDLKRGGWRTFIVSAIPSHSGGTAGGQLKLLPDYSIAEKVLAVPVQATMDTVVTGEARTRQPQHRERKTFELSTDRYKVGRVFIAWLRLPEPPFRADRRTRPFPDPDLAGNRMPLLLAPGGTE